MLTHHLKVSEREAVLALAERAEAFDGVSPLNEEARIALSNGNVVHSLIERDGVLLGYLQYSPKYDTAQFVVRPSQRRGGVGEALLHESAWTHEREVEGFKREECLHETTGLWAFGNLEPARRFAAKEGFKPSRSLLIMGKALEAPLPGPETRFLPDGLTIRSFTEDDLPALLEVNAQAFKDHPEQGKMDEADFRARAASDWFDPKGLFLAFDPDGLVGFHWTKIEPGTPEIGEVYVIATAPEAQGKGVGRALLDAGLSYLQKSGVVTVRLYVSGEEAGLVRFYEKSGFAVASKDVLYTRSFDGRGANG
ncbi:MAG: mycothiol synthase [Propionibacteriaceae bacterium]|jgi:mycothiol synthase|nr:mycothiol synthase [Propionibacteriaceae bacterium]